MLKNTFCHLPGIDLRKERELWASGIYCWESLIEVNAATLHRRQVSLLAKQIRESFEHLERNNPRYFSELLPQGQSWRLFPEFRHSIAYLDVETTGLKHGDSITTIAIYDGQSISYYIQNQNLENFKKDIREYTLIVTYNGKCFDIPFIERCLGVRVDQAHIDLRYVLQDLGYRGGLKECERKLGIDRGELAEVNGCLAVFLWDDFKRNRNPRALETLLAYNVQDVLSLEVLLVIAYNKNLANTPFHRSHHLLLPSPPKNPFEVDKKTVERIKSACYWR
jgi:uncharacterized protein YprB with RNaseH-like and TPR domain